MNFPRTAVLSILFAVSIVTLIEIEHNHFLASLSSRYYLRFLRRSKSRIRCRFRSTTLYLSDEDFRHYFRISRRRFNRLIIFLIQDLRKDDFQARKSSFGAISPSVCLAISLRILAGGLHHDQML